MRNRISSIMSIVNRINEIENIGHLDYILSLNDLLDLITHDEIFWSPSADNSLINSVFFEYCKMYWMKLMINSLRLWLLWNTAWHTPSNLWPIFSFSLMIDRSRIRSEISFWKEYLPRYSENLNFLWFNRSLFDTEFQDSNRFDLDDDVEYYLSWYQFLPLRELEIESKTILCNLLHFILSDSILYWFDSSRTVYVLREYCTLVNLLYLELLPW